LDTQKNGLIKVQDPSVLFYLGYGFKQPKPGKWVVTVLTTETTPPEGADYAIMATFNGGATLTARTDLTLPALNEPVQVSAALTDGGQPVPLQSAQASVRKPDGSMETLDMEINGNTATVQTVPQANGIYGIEVSVTALAPDGMPVDRGAFLSFEVQPVEKQFALVRYLIAGGIVLFLALVMGIFFALRARKRRIRISKPASGSRSSLLFGPEPGRLADRLSPP
jgi:hypothetical protein